MGLTRSVSQPGPVCSEQRCGRSKAHRKDAGLCLGQALAPSVGAGADDAHMTHGPGSGHSGKSALRRENENQDLELHLGAGAPGPGVPGYVREEDFHLHATCPSVAALVPLHHRQSSGFFPRGGRAH